MVAQSQNPFAETVIAYAGRKYRFRHNKSDDHIFSVMVNSGTFYEIDVLASIAQFLKPGDHVFDVGANMGTHAVFFAGVCKCLVTAFEPNSDVLEVLRANLVANRLKDRVTVEPVALGKKSGRGRVLAGAENNLGTASMVIDESGDTLVRRLDSYAGKAPITLIKIDVEGFELDVLKGARKTISRDHPVIVVEARKTSEYAELQTLLGDFGYVSAGSYGFTPTHVFVSPGKHGVDQIVSAVGGGLALDHIADFERNDRLNGMTKWVGDVHTGLRGSQATIGKMEGQLHQQGQDMATLREKVDGLGTNLTNAGLQCDIRDAALQERIVAISQDLDTANEIISTLSKQLSEASALLGQQSAQTVETLTKEITALREGVESKLALAAEQASAASAHAAEKLSKEITTLRGDVNGKLALAAEQASAASAHATEKILKEIAAFRDDVDAELARTVEQAAEMSAANVGRYLNVATKTLTEHIAALGAALGAESLEMNAAVSSLANLVNKQRSAITDDLAEVQERLQALDEGLSAARTRDGAAVEMQLLAGSVLEARIEAVQRAIKSDQRRLVEDVIAPAVRTEVDAMGHALAGAVGRQLAELEIGLREVFVDQTLGMLTRQGRAALTVDSLTIEAALARIEGRPLGKLEPSRAALPAETHHTGVWGISEEAAQAFLLSDSLLQRAAADVSKPRLHGLPARSNSDPVAASRSEGERRGAMPPRFTAPAAVSIANESFSASWSGRGWPQPGIELQPGGKVICNDAKRDSGIVGRSFKVEGGGVIEVEINSTTLGDGGKRRILRLIGDDGDGIGHDYPLVDGSTVARAYVPERVKAVKIYVLANDPKPGPLFALSTLELRKVDGEAYQWAVRTAVGEPVFASMASIPSRRGLLQNAVASLLVQCDKIRVFLNNYSDIPPFLEHPRIEVRRSQDWDDRGDAGKAFWMDRDRDDGGYRLIVDDDLIFPPDFAVVMTGKVAAHGDRAIFATHGVLLRQPLTNYYDNNARAATFHFGRELKSDRGVHIGATNALCLHTSAVNMRWPDFKYCNSADIWLSLYAQQHGLPILTPARPRNWVREGRHTEPNETIYLHSRQRTRTRFDSSFVQDAVLRHVDSITLQPAVRRKLGVAFMIDGAGEIQSTVESFVALRSVDVEWVVILVLDATAVEHCALVDALQIEHETHLVDSQGDSSVGLAAVARLHDSLRFEATVIATASTRFAAANSATAENGLMPGTFMRNGDATTASLQTREGNYTVAAILADTKLPNPIQAFEGAFRTREGMLGGLCLTAAINSVSAADDLSLSEMVAAISRKEPAPRRKPRDSVNGLFERVQVLNLDRRPDRWRHVSAQLEAAGITAQRFSAVDGSNSAVRAEFETYARRPIHRVSDAVPKVVHSTDLYLNYASQMARIAHLEEQSGKKAIETAGAWGYLRSYETILEQALADQVETLLVFDDDVVLHKNFKRLFAAAVAELPDDWLIVQLGTLQYNWSAPWVEWRSQHLYSTNGSAVGSHAVGMHFDAFPTLIDHVKRMDMPFDIGALSSITRAFADRCFVIHPNLAIQRLADSDINSSDFQKTRSPDEVARTYRWNLENYLL